MEIAISASLAYTKLCRDNKRELWSPSREVLRVTGIEMHFCSRRCSSQLASSAGARDQKPSGVWNLPLTLQDTQRPNTEA